MYKLVKQKRKTISIGIDENLQIIVKAPHHVPGHYVDEFVEKHKEWIARAIANKRSTLELQDWWQRKQLLYLGEVHVIVLRHGEKESVKLIEDQLILTLVDPSDQPKAEQLMEKWLTENFRVLVTELSDKYCKLLGCDYNKIYIRKQRTRWGSCSSKGNLSFNSRLICAPRRCIEYVALHEVMHLMHFNHGKQFWKAIEAIMPQYKSYQNILKLQGKYYHF
ncbi:MAG: M48 family metallopeptidase [Cellulosilyticaceae bacterium]